MRLYDLPFLADDLQSGERYAWGKKSHAGGVQKFGYDFGARRFDAKNNRWSSVKIDPDEHWANPKNANYVIYGKPAYAIAPGVVVAGWRNAPENPRPKLPEEDQDEIPFEERKWLHTAWREKRMPGGGNHLWIQQDDGVMVLYAHFIPGTIPQALCPNNKPLFDQPGATSETDIPEGQRARVEAGQFLGLVGNSGNSTNPHHHLNGQVGEQAEKLHFRRGLWTPLDDDQADIDKWEPFPEHEIPPGPILIWPPRRLGPEYARHGYPAQEFQRLFDHLADSGYMPVWLDGYTVGGETFFNTVWRPATGEWRAFFGQTSQRYQDRVEQARADGFTVTHVESYLTREGVRYALICLKGVGAWRARHGLTSEQHEQELDQAKQDGFQPGCVSVVSIDGQRFYTVLYRKLDLGKWQVSSRLSAAEYQAAVNDHRDAGQHPFYVSAYMHNGEPHFAAIFSDKPNGTWRARHGLTPETYQDEFELAHGDGLLTRVVTGYDGAQQNHRYAAVWRK